MLRATSRTRSPLALVSLCLLLCSASLASAAATIYISNLTPGGSFESINDFSTCTVNNLGATNCNAGIVAAQAPPWSVSRAIDVLYPPSTNCSDGVRCIDLNTDALGGGTLQTPLSVRPGATYRLQFDLGTRRCVCPTFPSARNATVTAGSLGATLLSTNIVYGIGDDSCAWHNYTLHFSVPIAASSDVIAIAITSNVAQDCGVLVDNVRLYWAGCFGPYPIDISDPASSGYVLNCTDEWLVTPPATPVPLVLTGAPVVIVGSLTVTKLDITVTDPLATTLTVTDTVTLGGQLVLDLTQLDFAADAQVTLVNATQVVGAFTGVDMRFKQSYVCGDVVSDSQSVIALVRVDCESRGKKGLAKWKIAVITVCVVLAVGVATGTLLYVFRKRSRTARHSARSV